MRRFLLKLRKRANLERDLDAELEFHRGRTDRPFGNATQIREDARELWTFPFVESLLRDFRHSFRVLAKSPSFSMVSLLTLGLGIGINTAVFTLYDSLTYRLLPVEAPQELVRVARVTGRNLQAASFSYGEFESLREGLAGAADAIATTPLQTIPASLAPGAGIREGIRAQAVTGDYFEILGVRCELGRAFGREDRAGAVVSHAYWARRFHEDPALPGKTIDLDGVPFTILGVAPEGFYGSDMPPHLPDVWIPLTAHSQAVQVLARRRRGVGVEQVTQRLQGGLTAINATAFQTNMGGFRGTGTIGFILMGAAGVVLLIGCVNLVHLTLSRNSARKRELAVRLAIGASRRQIVQQLCAESLVLGVAGGAIGLALSVLLCHWIRVGALAALDRISHEFLGGFQLDLTPDWRVFAYTLSLSVVTAAMVGIWPALHATRTDLHASLESEGFGRGQRHLLLTAQIAACFVLLTGAGLLFRGAWQSRSADPGFGLDHVLLMNVDLTTIEGSPDVRSAMLKRVLDGMRSLGEVASLAVVDRAPFLGTGSDQFENESHRALRCRFNRVSGEYFETLQVPILAGRSFSPGRTDEVVVSEAAARAYWPDQSPLGGRISFDGQSQNGLPHLTYTVVGVAKTVRNTFLSKADSFYLYFPKPVSDAGGWVLARTRHSPDAALASVRGALLEVSPALASHAYLISLAQGPVQIQKLMTEIPGAVALGLGLLALLLATVGVYGVVMYFVAQRIRVIGIHMALGARRIDVVRLVLGEGLACVAQGALAGLLGGLCLSGVLAGLVKAPDLPDLTYQAGVFDPATFLIALGALTAAVAAACLGPAYRATKVDPVIALRNG